MKLTIELVPESAWDKNLRENIPQGEWKKIREECYEKSGRRCEICGSNCRNQLHKTRGSIAGTPNCHEIWEYDDKNHIQKLKGFIALCNDCHLIKHIGFANIMSSQGHFDMECLIKHFIEVNDVSKNDYEKHKEESFDLWDKRNRHKWTTDFSQWKDLVKK